MTMNHLVDRVYKFLNMELINTIIDPFLNPIILRLLISRTFKADMLGWHCTKSDKYTIKLGYYITHNGLTPTIAKPLFG